ncbi:MAG: DRTGG domain-containing protein [Oscillospiraceae bacterium]
MAGKQDAILKYIEALSPGTRISVRGLAKDAEVSEGTAYKAIKRAELERLVQTKPKVGTIRINSHLKTAESVSLSSLIGRLGLTILEGGDFASEPIGSIILGDGSLRQFSESLRTSEGKPLCLVGDRPEILQAAAEYGASIVLTGGASADTDMLALAFEHSSCVLSTERDSGTLLRMAREILDGAGERDVKDPVRTWMGMPLYLYGNDVVADWHKLYRPVFSMSSVCAVVNDDLSICGTMDAFSAITATPSQKISNLCRTDMDCCVADEGVSMRELADRMISESAGVAFITNGGKMCGIMTANDMLRYFLYNTPNGDSSGRFPDAMETIDRNPQTGRNVYMVKLPGAVGESADSPDLFYPGLLSAARRHCEELFGAKCDFESGTFYSLGRINVSGELMISSEILKRGANSCTIQLEMYDDAACYARCTLIAGVSDGAGR